MNKDGVSRKQFTKTDVKHFKSGALAAITNIAEKEYTSYCNGKKEFLHEDFVHA